MADKKPNFNAPLLSTRQIKNEVVPVQRNMTKKLTDDGLETNESVSVPNLVQDIGLDPIPFKCPLKKAIQEEEDVESEDDEDDVFCDALDTLSLKHSISGNLEAMPSEDNQPQDFMLNRFLPAAKSMTVEKQQPLRQIKDIVPFENVATPERYEFISTPSYYDQESEGDDEVSEYISKRGCGLMSPQLCFKNSVGMLSKVNSHDQVKSSKLAQLKSRFQSMKKLALDSIYKQKSGSRAQSPSVFEQLESNMSNRNMPSTPCRQSSYMSPHRSVGNSSPLNPSGFLGTHKEAEIMRANRLNKHIRRTTRKYLDLLYPKSTRLEFSTSSVMEKTLDKEIPSKEQEMAGKISKMEAGEREKNDGGCDLSPLSLPPPKKPSDSWLFRSLPSRNDPQKKDVKGNSTSVTKWETIVKTSYMQRHHICYSEDLSARSSCQSKP